jgi:excisionase family DNA binding protein
MSAYAAERQDLPQREPSDPVRVADRASPARRNAAAFEAVRVEGVLETLLAALADRVAEAVVAGLGREERPEPGEWLDSRAAADYLGVHRDTLRRLAAERTIPSEQDGPGCKLYFLRGELDAWRRKGGPSFHLAAIA